MDDGNGGDFYDLYGVLTDTLAVTYTTSNITKGKSFGFRYRAKNIYGWGDYSDPIYILAASVPSAPVEPTLSVASDNSITLNMELCPDNGGSPIIGYYLYMNTGTDGSTLSRLATYSSTSFLMTHTVDTTNDAITTGKIYQFYWSCYNIIGESDPSSIISVSVNAAPSTPSAPYNDYTYSDSTSLYVNWGYVSDGVSPGGLIIGYKLYMDDGYGGDFDLIYDTVNVSPTINAVLISSLTTGLYYRFKVAAYNYNGASSNSSITSLQPCSIPSGWSKPNEVSTTTSSITISWNEPTSNGGCSITGYAVFIDDGNSGSYVEANADLDISVRDIPSLSTLTITRNLPATGNDGNIYRVKVRAYNPAGYLESAVKGIRFAIKPLAPPAPTKVSASSG